MRNVSLVAAAALAAALALLPATAGASLSAGQAAMQDGDYAKAEAEFRKVVKGSPRTPDAMKAWVNLGVIAFAKDDVASALSAYEQALAIKADDSKALNGKATALLRMNRIEEAIATFEAAAKANPKDPLPFFNLGYLALRSNQINVAEGLFGLALVADPSSPDGRTGLAEIALVKGDYKQAVVEAKAALRSDPRSVGALLMLGKAYIALDRWAEASEALGKAKEFAGPSNAEVAFSYGIALFHQERYADAGMAFADALDVAPDDPQIHLYGGLCFYQLGDIDAAAEELQHVLDLGAEGRDRSTALYHIGLILDGEGDLAQAETAYREALKEDPKNALAANNLGLIYQRTKRLSEAVTSYRRALSADPELLIARLNLGHALWLSGLKGQAKVELEKVRDRLPPGHELREKAEQILASGS